MTRALKPRSTGMGLPALLHVEDYPDDVLFFQLAWEKAGIPNPVRFAGSKREAVEYLEGRGKFADRGAFPIPSVIIIDMRLPDGNASDFLRWIRAHPKFKKLVVIVWSGTADEEEIKEAYRSGANSFLLKTPNLQHLQKAVNLIRSYWLNQNLAASRAQAPVLCGSEAKP